MHRKGEHLVRRDSGRPWRSMEVSVKPRMKPCQASSAQTSLATRRLNKSVLRIISSPAAMSCAATPTLSDLLAPL